MSTNRLASAFFPALLLALPSSSPPGPSRPAAHLSHASSAYLADNWLPINNCTPAITGNKDEGFEEQKTLPSLRCKAASIPDHQDAPSGHIPIAILGEVRKWISCHLLLFSSGTCSFSSSFVCSLCDSLWLCGLSPGLAPWRRQSLAHSSCAGGSH